MKKILSSFILLALLLSSSLSFASVGIRLNGSLVGEATDINVVCGSGTNTVLTNDGAIYNIGCSPNLAETGLASSGYVSMTSSQTAVNTSYSFIRKVLDSDGNSTYTAGTLANGIPGQILTIYAAGISPSGATTGGNFTITPTNSIGFTSIKMSAVNDVVTLIYLNDATNGSGGWYIMSYTPGASNSITITLKA